MNFFLPILLLLAGALRVTPPRPALVLPLSGDTHLAAGQAKVSLTGPHRFLKVGDRRGFQPLSLETKLKLVTDLHRKPRGSIVLWVCPLETLAVVSRMESFIRKDPLAQEYTLLSDTWPSRDPYQSVFSWHWRSVWHPQVMAKFVNGWPKRDQQNDAYLMIEHLPLKELTWYQLVLTWDMPAHRMLSYVNGILAGATLYPFHPDDPRPELYIGNSAMIFSGLEMYGVEITAADVESSFRSGQANADPALRRQLLEFYTVQPKPALRWSPGSTWHLSYHASFTDPKDLEGWTQQGCTGDPFRMKELRITSDGLLMETPDRIDNETRMYLWSPKVFEGDIAIEFEFRPERATGLALLVAQASGMQREDFLTDHPKRTSGSMSTIIGDRVRNYHWEFFRKTGDVRSDLQTEILVKNPWTRPLGMSCLPDLAIGRFHKLLFLQEGAHIRCAIDGQVALDATDDAFINLGPVFNSGRIGIRLMYQTRMLFRNLKVWNLTPAFVGGLTSLYQNNRSVN